MAYNDYSMGGYIPGDYETEEQRRRRLLEEQAQAQAQDQENGISQQPAAGGGVDLAGMASRYVGNRVGAAQQRVADAGQVFTDPQAALDRRMGMTEQPDAANTEVQSQQVKTYADGSQEHVVKTQTPAPAPVAVAPTPIEPQPQMAQPAAAPAPQMAQPAAQAQAPQAQPTPVPGQLPAAPVSPEDAARQEAIVRSVQQQAQNLPQPGEGVQLAGPMVPGAVAAQPATTVTGQAQVGTPQAMPNLQQGGAQAQATRPQWALDLEAAGADQTKLIDIAANKSYPQDVRDDAKAKLRTAMASADAATEAEKTVTAAAQGDPRAQQKLLNSIKPASIKKEAEGPVTEGSYIRAYLYARLGLNDLAQEEQQKIMGKSKFGQVTVDGQSFEVETDPRSGRVMLARDAEGNKVDAPILNKIRAESAKFGTHAYGFTGGSLTIPPSDKANAGQEYRQRTNSVTGQIENIITTGPNAGKAYTGAPGYEKRVETNAAVKLNDAYIDFQTKPTIAMATQMLELAGKVDNGKNGAINNAMAEIQRRSPGIFQQVQPLVANITAQGANAPVQGGGTTTTGGGGKTTAGAGAGTTATGVGTTTTGGGGGGSLLQQQKQQEANIDINTAAAKENIQVAGKRSESFNKHIDDNITPDAVNGDSIASTRKQQFAIFDRPGVDAGKIFGIANGAGSAPGDQRWTMFRDVLLGKVSEPADKIRERAAALGLNPQEQSAVAEYAIANADINSKTLKSTAGPGSVSEAEQKINQERNVDPTKVPMLGGYNAMAQSQFNGDLAKYKGDWSLTSKASNTAQLESDWRKEKTKLTQMYTDMVKQRIDYISGMGNTPAAIKEGYRRFPVPEYDANSGTWTKKKPITSYDK